MEIASDMDDDAFFVELKKQITLLMTDEDEPFPKPKPNFPKKKTPLFFSPQPCSPWSPVWPVDVLGEPNQIFSRNLSAGFTIGSMQRESSGTGVFIPRVSVSRRRPLSGSPPIEGVIKV
ncbi:uncharacterized protein LOC18421955 isoform X3 [Amborella trichopoda]|uniref:uncharacterized protein LOC18421955 isoform X3 n=1 Tax=Amborella trichopoda TaxID=13333 RepID=UPI0005D41E61|nr:uncharacterized protein LOC18421955 isoform X3 [Amborella trichopoda]|eukprot:XP_011620998.1 uncharacterized protein LOC18421955 isoform X3 [Amborella trichopoda]